MRTPPRPAWTTNKVSDYTNNLYDGNGNYSFDYSYDYIADYLHANHRLWAARATRISTTATARRSATPSASSRPESMRAM